MKRLLSACLIIFILSAFFHAVGKETAADSVKPLKSYRHAVSIAPMALISRGMGVGYEITL